MLKLTKDLLYDPKVLIGTVVGGSLALHVGWGLVESRQKPAEQGTQARAITFPSKDAPSGPSQDAGAADRLNHALSVVPYGEAQSPSGGGNLEAFKDNNTSLEDLPDLDGGPLADASGAEPRRKAASSNPPAVQDKPSLAPQNKLNNAGSIDARPLGMSAPPAAVAAPKPKDAAPAPLAQAKLPDKPAASRRFADMGRRSADLIPFGAKKFESVAQPQSFAAPGVITAERFEGPGSGFNSGDHAAPGGTAHPAESPQGGGPNGEDSGTEYRYGPHELNNLDFYGAGGGKKPHPLVIFFHGGSFYRGDKKDAKDYLSLRSRGYAMASCNYRLLKDPSQFGAVALADYDARNAVRWLRDNAAMLGVDPDRFVAVGASAGGYLAAMLGSAGDAALSDEAVSATSPAVQAVIDLAGPTDFGGMVIAPIQFVSGNDPPTMIRHGRDDTVVSYQESLNYAYKLQGANVRVDVKILDGVGHAIEGSFKEQLIKESLDFADTVVKGN